MFTARLSASASRAASFSVLVRSAASRQQACVARAPMANSVKALHGYNSPCTFFNSPGAAYEGNQSWRRLFRTSHASHHHRRNMRANSSSSSSEAPSNGGGGGSAGGGSGSGGSGGGGGNSGGDGSGSSAAGVAGLWALYLKMVDTNPVLTKSITSALLNAFGDVMSQVFIEGDHDFDWKRLAKFTAIGLVLVGPVLHFWYGTLAKLVTMQGSSGAALRLALDQLVFAPIFISMFFTTLCCFEGEPQKVTSMLKQEWWPAVQTNWKIWVPFQFVNFRLVPQNLQVLFANFVALIWNTYLSFASHRGIEEEAPPEDTKGKKGKK